MASIQNNAIENNLRFAGQYSDAESDLYYNFFRDYDPELGRYLQTDPIGEEAGVNTYIYTLNNPINSVDPDGLFAWQLAGCAIGVGLNFNNIRTCDDCGNCTINWGQAALSCGAGALGGGILGKGLWGKGPLGIINKNRYLRFGWGKGAGSKQVLRAGGNLVKKVKPKNPHIDIVKTKKPFKRPK